MPYVTNTQHAVYEKLLLIKSSGYPDPLVTWSKFRPNYLPEILMRDVKSIDYNVVTHYGKTGVFGVDEKSVEVELELTSGTVLGFSAQLGGPPNEKGAVSIFDVETHLADIKEAKEVTVATKLPTQPGTTPPRKVPRQQQPYHRVSLNNFDGKYHCICWKTGGRDLTYCDGVKNYFNNGLDIADHRQIKTGSGRGYSIPIADGTQYATVVVEAYSHKDLDPTADEKARIFRVSEQTRIDSGVAIWLDMDAGESLKIAIRALDDYYSSVPEYETVLQCIKSSAALPCKAGRHQDAQFRRMMAFNMTQHQESLVIANAYCLHNNNMCKYCLDSIDYTQDIPVL